MTRVNECISARIHTSILVLGRASCHSLLHRPLAVGVFAEVGTWVVVRANLVGWFHLQELHFCHVSFARPEMAHELSFETPTSSLRTIQPTYKWWWGNSVRECWIPDKHREVGALMNERHYLRNEMLRRVIAQGVRNSRSWLKTCKWVLEIIWHIARRRGATKWRGKFIQYNLGKYQLCMVSIMHVVSLIFDYQLSSYDESATTTKNRKGQ